MTDTASAASEVGAIRDHYLELTQRRRLYSGITLSIFVLLMASGFYTANDLNAGGFLRGIGNFFDFPASVVGEAIEEWRQMPGHLLTYLPDLIETLNIAAAATLIGALFAIAFALLSTRGLAPFPWLIPVIRRLMDVMRAIPDIIIALMLIFVFGGGPIPAMVAIAFHTAGALGKLFSEVAENASLKPVDGLQSVGASWMQRMYLGVIPQVAPNWLSYALLRFEINIRASAILGYVGAGGIGYELRNTMSWGQGKFDDAAAIFILLFLTIVVVDQFSSRARHRLINGGAIR
ncbi:phosphonate ABC transporter, permease protein PhnE [Qingshengfaniella alkalisoli]|uniref:Phosphonate ABC transporter, permease protein PhnE n=1 Tax=Qingshengfaniella alkalisoli TaxID=2599296 RepID=A0A5B8IAC5_9RHOB|nr:phosphonate ABC transporter, permease protein PhnE [Qingshengfaniella alkalisoli]QDY71425.1 phosphonate ABC transporter, permease protein PhnE [Qingshengfaniella alkalisoli]